MKKFSLSRFIASDIFGVLLLITLCVNRALYSLAKAIGEDVLIYRYDHTITPQHWLESVLPLGVWVAIWGALGLLCVVSLKLEKMRPPLLGAIVCFCVLWGTSQIASPQTTASISGVLWVVVALTVIWGSARVSPEKAENNHQDGRNIKG